MKTLLGHCKENRKVSKIWINGANGDVTVKSDVNVNLHIEEEYLGDRSEIWVIQSDDAGREYKRYNTRFITEIEWE